MNQEGGCLSNHREDLLKQFELLNRHKLCDRLLGIKDEELLFNASYAFVNDDAADGKYLTI